MSADGPSEAESNSDTPSASVASAAQSSEKKTCKLLLVGPPCSGKSSLLQAYNGADFDAYGVYRPTTSSDFTVKDVRICEADICLQVWDVGGNSMGRSFLRGSNAVVLVVDLTNLSSMDGLDALYERVRIFSGFPDDNFPCILLGNKSDLAIGSKREITFDMLVKWAQERRQDMGNRIHCFEASAKTKSGVLEAFNKACEIFLRKPVSPGAPSFVLTTSSVVDDAESATSGPRRGIPNRSFMNSSGGSMEDEDIPIAKIVLAGPPNAGKTCMLTRFVSSDSEIPVRHEPTIGADFRVSEVQVNDITLTLQIWDTAGDKKMLSIGKSLYKNADGIVLVYDITSRASFKNLDIYWDNFLKYSGMDEAEFFPAVLVGNKSDLSDKREVSLEEVIDWCTNKRPQKPITYLECSARLDIGVRDVFNFITHAHYDFALCPVEVWTDTDYDDTETEYDEAFEPSQTGSISDGAPTTAAERGSRKAQSSASRKVKTTKSTETAEPEKTCWCKFF